MISATSALILRHFSGKKKMKYTYSSYSTIGINVYKGTVEETRQNNNLELPLHKPLTARGANKTHLKHA